ncbi:MAG: hypothetical protein SRB1_00139 [Desulfobacteraceae bacterium Eth-SRB1]|nr:MAG: hypothetical protein SRB1_00139 [Desulfobacteraceae bacterium Eth-SRB1]
MEPTTGIEPVNLFLTKEALYRLSYVGNIKTSRSGAGDEIRTRDLQLGRLELYQLSYSRSKKTCKTKPLQSESGIKQTIYYLNEL